MTEREDEKLARVENGDIVLPNGYRVFVGKEFCEEDVKEINSAVSRLLAAERERCAKIAEDIRFYGPEADISVYLNQIAAAIREAK